MIVGLKCTDSIKICTFAICLPINNKKFIKKFMGLRYRRRVKVAPGIHLNFSGSGVSTSIGVKGASITKGKKGTYVNVGIPGTGLSYREKVNTKCYERNTSDYITVQHNKKSEGFIGGLYSFFVKVFFGVTLWSFFSAIFEGGIMWLVLLISLAIFALFRILWLRLDSKDKVIQSTDINASVCDDPFTKSIGLNTNNDAEEENDSIILEADTKVFINKPSDTSANNDLDENLLKQSKTEDMNNLTNVPINFNGTYKEFLPCKYGELCISKNMVQLDFYIPGPDLRYNGSFYHLRCPEEVDEMRKCLLQGWNRCETISNLNLSGSIEERINDNITIRCSSGYHNGVCVFGYAFVFNSKDEVDNFIDILEQAKIKGELIHKSLFGQ